jgi:hypothetical protein
MKARACDLGCVFLVRRTALRAAQWADDQNRIEAFYAFGLEEGAVTVRQGRVLELLERINQN